MDRLSLEGDLLVRGILNWRSSKVTCESVSVRFDGVPADTCNAARFEKGRKIFSLSWLGLVLASLEMDSGWTHEKH